MTNEFSGIDTDDYGKLKDAIVWITILVAGADDVIDNKEKEWAEKLTQIRSYASEELLNQFYEDVEVDFTEKLDKEIEELPNSLKNRNQILESRLKDLNPVLARLDTELGAALYTSYESFATHVAKASGGFFRFFSMSSAEKEVVGLNMLDKIVHVDEEE